MRIQKRFLLSITASLAISLSVILSVLSILQDMERETAGIEVYREIEKKTNALSLSIARYPSRPEASRIQQIKASRASLENLLKSLNSNDIIETALIRHISANTNELQYLLEKLISSTSEPTARERQNVLISHLRMKSQFILDDTQRLMEINQSQINTAQNHAFILIVSLICALVLINTAISLVSSKSIIRAQEGLSKALEKAQESERLTRQSQSRLVEAQRLAKVGDWEWDPIKDEVLWSEAMYDVFGRSPELSAPTYQELRRYYTNDNWALLEESVKNALESGRSYERELEYIREDDTHGWHITKGEAEFDNAGRIIKLRGTAQDITTRKLAEEALRKSEERFRALMSASSEGLYRMSPDWSEMRHLHSHGFLTNTERPSRSWRNEYIYPDDQEQVTAAINNAVGNKSTFTLEHRVLRADGSVGWTFSRAVPLLDANGEIVEWFGAASDITERKRAEEALAESLAKAEEGERTLEALMEYVPEGITIADAPDVRIRRVSRYGVELTGKTNEELTGIPADQHAQKWDIYEADGVTLASNENMPLTRATKYGEIVKDKEYVLGNPNSGHRVPILCNAAPILNQHGKITGGIIAWRDITDRKKAEEALRQWSETLEQKVAERTALAEKRASQLQSLSVELIEAEERERRRIAQLMHEDLQQNLAAARFQLQAFRQDLSPQPALVNIEKILVESIAQSRRITHELSPPMLEHSSLGTALQWLVRHMGEQFGLQVDLEVNPEQEFDSEPVKIFIFRALQELLFNVHKHSGVNSAKVRLTHQDDRMVVMVSDQGRGFDMNILDTTIVKDCFGLLSLRERASYIGGNFLIQSAPEQGSRFILSVPFSLPPSGVPKIDVPVCKHSSQDSEGSGGIRVLLVDDHKVMRQGLIKLISGQTNIEVVGEAANGLEAIELARRIKPHVIVMDISMPGMNGVEATRIIKGELPEVRVIGLSMFEDENILRAMLEARAETLLSKTSSSTELIKAIYGMRSKSKNRAEKNNSESINLDLENL